MRDGGLLGALSHLFSIAVNCTNVAESHDVASNPATQAHSWICLLYFCTDTSLSDRYAEIDAQGIQSAVMEVIVGLDHTSEPAQIAGRCFVHRYNVEIAIADITGVDQSYSSDPATSSNPEAEDALSEALLQTKSMMAALAGWYDITDPSSISVYESEWSFDLSAIASVEHAVFVIQSRTSTPQNLETWTQEWAALSRCVRSASNPIPEFNSSDVSVSYHLFWQSAFERLLSSTSSWPTESTQLNALRTRALEMVDAYIARVGELRWTQGMRFYLSYTPTGHTPRRDNPFPALLERVRTHHFSGLPLPEGQHRPSIPVAEWLI